MNLKNSNTQRLSPFNWLLARSASIDEDALGDIRPSEQRKALGRGWMPLISMMVAFIGGAYFVSRYISSNPFVYLPAAAFWSFAVYKIEVICSEWIRDQDNLHNLWAPVLVRLAIALSSGLVVTGVFVEEVIFGHDTTRAASELKQAEGQATRAEILAKFDPEIAELRDERKETLDATSGGTYGAAVANNPLLKQLAEEKSSAQVRVNRAKLEVARQQEGTAGRSEGYGPLAKAAQERADAAQGDLNDVAAEYEATKQDILDGQNEKTKVTRRALEGDVPTINRELEEATSDKAKALARLRADMERPLGPILKTTAFWKMVWEQPAALFKVVPLMLLVACLETLAVVMALFSIGGKKTSYDIAYSKKTKADEAGFDHDETLENERQQKAVDLERKQDEIYVEQMEKVLRRRTRDLVEIKDEAIQEEVDIYRDEVRRHIAERRAARTGAGTHGGKKPAPPRHGVPPAATGRKNPVV